MGNIFTTQITCSGDVLINRCLDCIGGRCVYVSELEQNLKRLDTSIKELESLKNDVTTRIDIAERQGRKRLDHVQLWLSRVDIKVDKVKRLLKTRHHEIGKLCCGGCCSKNYVSSHKFGKKVVKRLNEVNDLITQEKGFKEVTKVTLPEPMVEIPCESTVGLEQKLDTVVSYLLEEETYVGIVGLYGDSGVGKTALLMQVNNAICSESCETSRFDLVICVAVSKSLNLESIQNHIGKKIGFYGKEWMSKSLNEKAVDIFNVLNKKKFVLLLDDIWEHINLTKIGVPLTNPNESKVVFTTPSERICGQMGAQKIVKVDPLGLKDSWRLFSQKIGQDTLDSNPEIKRLAEELAGECDGMPHTLVRWARDMACNRTTQDWINAIESLRSPMLDSQEIIEVMADTEEDDDECATTMGPELGETNVFGSPITDQTLRRMPQYADREQITAIDRGAIALARVTEDGKDVKAREYVKRLKERYGDGVATISIFYNATGSTLEFSDQKDWHGYLIEGLHSMKVKNGQWGVFVHKHDDSESGRRASTGGIVYRGENGSGEARDWLLAWDSPSDCNESNPKVFTEIRHVNHFQIQWSYLYHLLLNSSRRRRDVWGGCVSIIALDDNNEFFSKAILSLDSDE